MIKQAKLNWVEYYTHTYEACAEGKQIRMYQSVFKHRIPKSSFTGVYVEEGEL